jgi:hypothetical protein
MKGAHMMNIMVISHGAKMKKRGIAVGFLDPFHFACHGFERLIPGDPGKCTGSSLPDPLERIKEAIGRVNPLAVGTPPWAPPGPRTVIIVIVFDPYDPAPFDMHFHFAKPAAVAVADRSDDLFRFVSAWLHIPNLPFLPVTYSNPQATTPASPVNRCMHPCEGMQAHKWVGKNPSLCIAFGTSQKMLIYLCPSLFPPLNSSLLDRYPS